jgi:hypothetical protein
VIALRSSRTALSVAPSRGQDLLVAAGVVDGRAKAGRGFRALAEGERGFSTPDERLGQIVVDREGRVERGQRVGRHVQHELGGPEQRQRARVVRPSCDDRRQQLDGFGGVAGVEGGPRRGDLRSVLVG